MASDQLFDDRVKLEKEMAVASFDRFLRVAKFWQFLEVLVVFGLISWSSAAARVPEFLEIFPSGGGGGCFVEFSTYLLNHHVVFLFGNAIIVLLFALCRQKDANVSGGGHFYDFSEVVRQLEPILPTPPHVVDAPAEESFSAAAVVGHFYDFSEVVRELEPILTPPQHVEDAPAEESCGGGCNDEKRMVVSTEGTEAIPPCDCAAAAATIKKAKRQIKKFQRTQSEKLKQEIAVRRRREPQAELRRSETENWRKTVGSGRDIENLSSEEFRRRVDAFIRETKRHQFEEYHNYYQLLKM